MQIERPGWLDESSRLLSVVIEHQEYWEVTFRLQDGMVGGVPVIEIDRLSKRVRKVYHTQ